MALSSGSRRVAAVRLTLVLVATACGKGASSTPERSSARATAPTTGTGAAPACPKTGHWTPCQVKARLEAAGVAPRPDSGALELPALDHPPIRYLVGKSALAVYLYPDSSARVQASRALDSTKFIPPSKDLSMRGEATAIQNDNLLALLFSRIDQQRERVSDAFLAGAPQP